MTARAHVAAVMTLLAADVNLVVYDGEAVPTAERPVVPNRYAIVYASTPLDRGPRLSQHMSHRVFTVPILYFGDSPKECRWVAEHVQAALRRKRPVVTGFVCTPFQLVSAGQVNPDDSIEPPGWSATDIWQFQSAGALI